VSDKPLESGISARKHAAEQPVERKAAAVVSEQALKSSLALIEEVFAPNSKSPIPPEELPARLEQAMGLGRNSCRFRPSGRWPTRFSPPPRAARKARHSRSAG